MKFIFFFLFIPVIVRAQSDSLLVNIETNGKKLTATWLVESYEIDSMKVIQKTKGKKVFEETYIYGKLTQRLDKNEEATVVELSFDKAGKGSYQQHDNYPLFPQSDKIYELDYPTCQPFPELIVKDGKIIISMLHFGGKVSIYEIIELTDTKLVIQSNDGIKRVYTKIK